jgi:hypothetical protein
MTMKKNIIKAVFFVAITTFFVSLHSCDTGYNTVSFGSNWIYMPAATSSGLSSSKTFTVPSTAIAITDTSVFNFRSDTINQKLYIRLGVSASGKYASDGYTVNLGVDNDTTNMAVAWGNAQFPSLNYMAIPSTMYTPLPSTFTVPAGKNAGTFELVLNAAAVMAYATPGKVPIAATVVGKKLLLTVAISNPTNYLLNRPYAKTVVLIDVNALKNMKVMKVVP